MGSMGGSLGRTHLGAAMDCVSCGEPLWWREDGGRPREPCDSRHATVSATVPVRRLPDGLREGETRRLGPPRRIDGACLFTLTLISVSTTSR